MIEKVERKTGHAVRAGRDGSRLAAACQANRQTAESRIREYFLESSQAARHTGKTCAEAIARAAGRIVACLRHGGKLLICGNGGSAAQSQHMAAELVSALQKHVRRPALAAIALTTDTSILTAIGNDFGFSEVFERQVEALGCPGDVLLAISTSGNSENLIRAVETARGRQMETIALAGRTPSHLSEAADLVIGVPEPSAQHIQEMHLGIEHVLCLLVEEAICAGGPS